MKVMIDVPEEEYNIIKNHNGFMTWAEHLIANGVPIQEESGKIFEEIVVQYPIPEDLCSLIENRGKPYLSIKYEENGEHHVGFGTYKPEVLSRYLKEYFIQRGVE